MILGCILHILVNGAMAYIFFFSLNPSVGGFVDIRVLGLRSGCSNFISYFSFSTNTIKFFVILKFEIDLTICVIFWLFLN